MTESEPVTHTESKKKFAIQVHHTESKMKFAFKVQETIRFRIHEFEAQMDSYKPREYLWSEDVSSDLAPRAVWMLEVYPNSHTKKGRGDISVILNLTGPMKNKEETLDATCHIYLVDGSKGRNIDVVERRARNFGGWNGHYWGVLGPYNCGGNVSHDRVEKALQSDGSLLVGADIEFLVPYGGKAEEIFETGAPSGDERDLFIKWQRSIGQLRESGAHSDCTLMVGGEELKAHRNILSAISPIFGKMFGNEGFQEARDGIVRIEDPTGLLKDSTAKPYQALLSYAYSGSVDWSIYKELKQDVLVVACKYLVLDLKHHVERHLAREITTKSFTELALLAHTYSCDQLKKACVRFLSSNYAAMMLTPQWGDLMEARVDLACELLRLVREGKATASTTTAADGGTK